MDEKLKRELNKIKDLVNTKQIDLALQELDKLSNRQDMQPYVKVLQKLKYDIEYAKNINNLGLGDRLFTKIKEELESVVSGTKKKTEVKEKDAPITQSSQDTVSIRPIMPILPPAPPIAKIEIPKELISEDPYDLDNIDILQEVGPWGFINDMRRTIMSIMDPLLPYKMLKKERKK